MLPELVDYILKFQHRHFFKSQHLFICVDKLHLFCKTYSHNFTMLKRNKDVYVFYKKLPITNSKSYIIFADVNIGLNYTNYKYSCVRTN
jgi:hypothetical protein